MSHGSRGRIQRRKSRAAALRVESLEERRLLSASRGASHAVPAHLLDALPAADVAVAHIAGKIDANIGASGNAAKPSVDAIASNKPAHATSRIDHGVTPEPPGAIVSNQARQLSTLDRPSDGPASGKGWALGHLISKPSHDKPDEVSGKPLWTVSTASAALPRSEIASAGRPLSTTSKAVVDPAGVKHSVTVNVAAAPSNSDVSGSLAAVSDSKWPIHSSQGKVTPASTASTSRPITAPTTLPQSSTSKTVVDGDGDSHRLTVTSTSNATKWILSPTTPAKNTKPVGETGPRPAKIILSPGGGSTSKGTNPTPPRSGSVGATTPSSPQPVTAPTHSKAILSITPPASSTAHPPAYVIGARSPNLQSEAAISAQEQPAETEDADQSEAAPVTAAETPPTAPTPSNPDVSPPASLDAPPSHEGQQAPPLDAQAQVIDGEETECTQLDPAADSQAEATALAGMWASVATSDPGSMLAKACDALVETLPIDAAALDEALAELLDELEDLGNDLATSLAQAGVSPWIAAAALGTAAGAAHRRHRRQRRSVGTRAAVLAQFPELLGLVPRGDA